MDTPHSFPPSARQSCADSAKYLAAFVGVSGSGATADDAPAGVAAAQATPGMQLMAGNSMDRNKKGLRITQFQMTMVTAGLANHGIDGC